MPSIKRVSTLEGASDRTRVSRSLSSELLGGLCIDPSMWGRQRGAGVKGNFSISTISIFHCKARNKMLPNKSRSIFTSFTLFLLVNLKLAPSLAKLCIFCFFILSSKLLGLLLHSSVNSSRAQFPISVAWRRS